MLGYVARAREAFGATRRGETLSILARGSTQALIIFAIGHGLNFLVQIALARWMGVSEYGAYASVINWVTLLTAVASFGLDASVLRFVPQYIATRAYAAAHGYIRWAYGVTLVSSLVVAIAASGFILLISGGRPGLGQTTMMIGIWSVPASAMIDFQTGLGRAYRRVILAYTPSRILRHVIIFLGVVLLVLAGAGETSRNLVIMNVAFLSMLALGQWWQLNRVEPSAISVAPPAYDAREWTRVAIPLLGITLFLDLIRRTDILMISGLMDSASVGEYTVATRIAGLVTFFQMAVNGMATPMISAAHTEGNKRRMQHVFTIAAHITFWPTLLLAVALAVLSGQLLRLFGPGFADARTPLLILLAAQLVNASCGLVGSALAMTGRERDSLRVYATCAGLNIVAVYAGIRVAGINGAAVAAAGTVVTWNIWLHILSVRYLGVYPSVIAWFIRQRTMRRDPSGKGQDSA